MIIDSSEYSSRVPGFYQIDKHERLEYLQELCDLSQHEIQLLNSSNINLPIENSIGSIPIPLGIATNFIINNQEILIPYATEEASVIAAASNAAKIARINGGFTSQANGSYMIGQIQLLELNDHRKAAKKILKNKKSILDKLKDPNSQLQAIGGGPIDIDTRLIDTKRGSMLIIHLIVDTKDAMGANAVNTLAEKCAPIIEQITGGTSGAKILSNLCDERMVTTSAVFDKDLLGGDKIVERILDIWAFADADPYRAATHNKGIMNAITAIAQATGQDTRAIEAGAHAYAAISGHYGSVTSFEKDDNGNLVGSIKLPIAVGTVGGITDKNPIARTCLKIMRVSRANELAEVMAAAGLAQNVAALRAIASEGIQKGHMKLHRLNLMNRN